MEETTPKPMNIPGAVLALKEAGFSREAKLLENVHANMVRTRGEAASEMQTAPGKH